MHLNCWTVCHGFDTLSLNLLYFQLAEADNDLGLNLTQTIWTFDGHPITETRSHKHRPSMVPGSHY